MTLRRRLLLAFVVVVLVPLLVGIALVARAVPQSLNTQVGDELRSGRTGAAAVLDQICRSARLAAEVLGREAAADKPGPATSDVVARGLASYAVVTDPTGKVLSRAGMVPGAQTPQPDPAELPTCGTPEAARTPSMRAVAATVSVQSAAHRPFGQAAVALSLDESVLRRLVTASGTQVTLVAHGQVLASTLPAADAGRVAAVTSRALTSPHPVRASRLLVTARTVAPGIPTLAVSAPHPSAGGIELLLLLLLLIVVGLAALIGNQLARVTTRPLVELSDAAARVTAGDLNTRIEVRSADEVGRLAAAFNEMTDELRTYIGALQDSRDELRRNLGRLGDTLSSTHDLTRILTVILETGMASVHAAAGAILLTSAGRGELYLKVGRHLDDRGGLSSLRVPFGEGVTGRVAATGEPVHGRPGDDGIELSPDEPRASSLISVPLKRGAEVIGVLNLYDRIDADSFDDGDVATIRTFASQATVAIDNVLLHQEAQRLSITDGLTGLWNYRYFSMNFGKEIERAARFDRPLALLMLDLDHFKTVNDTYGHQRGDAVLVELATRVKHEIREVDTLARYGGEELVLILPETDVEGARHIADRICHAVRHRPFGGDGEPAIHVTVSIGAAVFPAHGSTTSALVRAADEALYAAKDAGRDQWRVAGVQEPARSADS